jgi:thioredoxin 1
MSVLNITNENFTSEVLDSKGQTVFVDFWASWCGPCRVIAPLYESLSESNNAKFVKVNIEDAQGIAMKYNIRSVPTFLAIRDGSVLGQMIGAGDLENFVNKYK